MKIEEIEQLLVESARVRNDDYVELCAYALTKLIHIVKAARQYIDDVDRDEPLMNALQAFDASGPLESPLLAYLKEERIGKTDRGGGLWR